MIGNLINVVLHVDKYLNVIIQNYGMWVYGLIFLVIFCETGLVFTPFLPGDSIIFATGALASMGGLNIFILFVIFYIAAVLGDTANYFIGKKIGNKILEKENIKFINREYLNKARRFYEEKGPITIVLGRFIPIIRTFVPFVAGIGEMNYSKFIAYNMFGGFLWVTLFLGVGYFFGNLPFIKNNFSHVVIGIVVVSLIPAVVTFVKEKRKGGNDGDDVLNTEIR